MGKQTIALFVQKLCRCSSTMKAFVLCLLAHQIFGQELPCSKSLTIDLSDSMHVEGGYLKDDVIYREGDYFISDGTIFGCLCKSRPCIRKCCAQNEMMVNNTCVNSGGTFNVTFYEGTNVSVESKLRDFHILHGVNCSSDDQYRFPIYLEESSVMLQTNGSLFVVSFGVQYGVEDYCIDVFNDDRLALVCEFEETNATDALAYGMIISMPFLLATFLVYLFLPETNLHRRALMSYVLTLFLGYIILVSVQLTGDVIPTVPCHLLGYSILFFFTVSFFWMNVMCVDMWLAFRGMRGYGGRKGAERKRFFFYCIYAWGMPMLHTLVVFSINTYVDETSTLHPAIGTTRCFVGEGIANFLYFYLPAMILIIINITLFILTGIKIHRVKKETSMLKHMDSNRHSYEDDKQQFNLYVKLLFAMGINWTTEIMSWAIENFWKDTPKAVFYFTDFINATYGVFIFFIFVFKRKIWKSLKKRYYMCIGKPQLAHAMSTTRGGTRTSNFSTTETGTSVNTDYRMSDMRNGRGEETALNKN